jgi:protein-disulfide isomerase
MRVRLGLTHYLVILLAVMLVGLSVYSSLGPNDSGPERIDVDIDDDPIRGDAQAPVTIVEFSDFACPACSFVQSTVKDILEDYQGQVRLVFRDFYFTSVHSQKAHEAAQCVFEQDADLYWEYHDLLYQRQNEWKPSSADAMTVFMGYAAQIGVSDLVGFGQCLQNGKFAEEVQKDMRDGDEYGVTGTPTFFVNGYKLAGVPTYEDFRSAIEEALRG